MNPIVIYHSHCADGFSAAWAVWRKHPDWEFHGGTHGEPPPYDRVVNREVWMVDFSYKREDMEKLLDVASKVWVLDHHKSAMEANYSLMTRPVRPLQGVFDMDRSGAGIAWDWFHHGLARPALLDRVEDRDLWRFKYPDTRDVQAALFSYPYNFETWDKLMLDTPLEELRASGAAISRKQLKDINELIGAALQAKTIAGYEVPVLNAPYFFGSEAGAIMAKGRPFSATYYDVEGARRFGLRSTDEGVDVSEIAVRFGGGGHRNAAGFSIKHGREAFSWSMVA